MSKECLCRHFYSPTYDREILTRTDHINLLATPKGYRWYGPGRESHLKKRAFQGKSANQKDEPKQFSGMARFMEEIWSVLTPELLFCLKEILEEEFGMTPRCAVQFIVKQYLKRKELAKEELCGCPTEDQLEWARNLSGTLASKVTQFTDMMTSAKRTERTRLLQLNLMDRLRRVLGIDPCADTPLNQVLWRIVEGLALWLSSLPGKECLENACPDFSQVFGYDICLQ